MDSHMLIQLCSLLKGFITHWAVEWFRAWMGSQMIHHVALLVEFFTTAIKPAVKDGIQSLSAIIHDLFSVICHAFGLKLFESVIQDLQLMQVVFDRPRRGLLLFRIDIWCLNLMVKDTILIRVYVLGNKSDSLCTLMVTETVVISITWLMGNAMSSLCGTIAGCRIYLHGKIIIFFIWYKLLLFPLNFTLAVIRSGNISVKREIVITSLRLYKFLCSHWLLDIVDSLSRLSMIWGSNRLFSIWMGMMCIHLSRCKLAVLIHKWMSNLLSSLILMVLYTHWTHLITEL